MALVSRFTFNLGRALLAALPFASGCIGLEAAGAHYYVNDHLATTVSMIDASGEIAALEADAFGSPLATSGAPERYTGKPYDSDLGAIVFPFRNYRAQEARWLTADPSGFPDGINGRFYIGVYANVIDPLGLAGWVVIHSSSDGGGSSLNTSGHSWISYTPDPTASNVNPSTITYGTWGNNPDGLGNGLHTNLEQGRIGDVTRTMWIDDAAEGRLYNTIADYTLRGQDGWGLLGPCSTFAADAWNNATGEYLQPGFPSTPNSLRDSIYTTNGNRDHGSGLQRE